ncbi:MAG: PrsW family intramembrane metalloprotease [Treponema sp.]|jgi:RsiW-degrading membrane proteinase PrsW (M82 family)|nr:PrsW family intramembrane metalloprotease [Treponema sp.]
MEGLWVFFLLIFIAALPVLLIYLWARSGKFPLSTLWFLFSLLAGILALGIAVLLQSLLSPLQGMMAQEGGLGVIFFHTMVRIALTEEAGRFTALFLLFRLGDCCASRIKPQKITDQAIFYPTISENMPINRDFLRHQAQKIHKYNRLLGSRLPGRAGPGEIQADGFPDIRAFGAAAGLTAGLGFALIESAVYGAANMEITLLRAVTSAPLHGACGARIGIAAGLGTREPVHALGRFVSAVAIHGMYNFMVVSPGLPAILLALLITFTALASSIQIIRTGAPASGPTE